MYVHVYEIPCKEHLHVCHKIHNIVRVWHIIIIFLMLLRCVVEYKIPH